MPTAAGPTGGRHWTGSSGRAPDDHERTIRPPGPGPWRAGPGPGPRLPGADETAGLSGAALARVAGEQRIQAQRPGVSHDAGRGVDGLAEDYGGGHPVLDPVDQGFQRLA